MIRPILTWTILLVAVYNGSAATLNTIVKRSVNDENTLIEVVNHCKCVRHYLCKNGAVITTGAGVIGRRTNFPVPCISENGVKGELVCCKLDPIKNETFSTKTNAETTPDKFPWMAAIFSRTTQGGYAFKCGGSLIHKRVVLTSSHNLDGQSPEDLVVVVNGKESRSLDKSTEDEKRSVSKIIRHHRYDKDTLFNDAALLILKEEFRLGGPNNIKLLSLQEDEGFDLEPYRCYVAGWGENVNETISDTLKRQELPFVNHTECQSLLRNTALGQYFELHDSFMCAGGEGGKDACIGDGGSPLMCKPQGESRTDYFQVGIVSWGMSCWQQNVPGVYTDVQKISEWIQNEVDNNT